MNKEEAIRHLEAARLMLLGKDNQPISDLYDALSEAIEALEAEPNEAEWYPENIRPKSSIFLCTNCGGRAYYPQNHHGDEKKCRYEFCPNCGAKMERGEANDTD